jgi:hypothetical protein
MEFSPFFLRIKGCYGENMAARCRNPVKEENGIGRNFSGEKRLGVNPTIMI